jgi:enoyl-CoA hydratase/carnithine racemase
MNGEIAPDVFGLNLALDLRVAAENTTFFNRNVELGFPPSSILSFYLLQNGPSQKSGHTEQPSCMRLQEVYHHGKTV